MINLDDRPSWLDRGRIPSLDGLRAVAIVLILVAHVHQTRGFPSFQLIRSIARVGSGGVEVFFVLSGFLITTLMIRESDRFGRFDMRAFYWRRALRILPAYVSFLMVVGSLQFAGTVQIPQNDWWAASTFTMNFRHHPVWELGHIWSLSIEEHFYLLWPLCVALVARQRLSILLISCLAACFVGRWVVLVALPVFTPMAVVWTFTRLDTIATGCLLAVIARQSVWRERLDKSAQWWPAVGLLLLVSLALAGVSTKWSVGVGYSLNNTCIALLIWAAVKQPPDWLNSRVIAGIGVGSYSLYLWQQLFLNPNRESWATTFPQNLVLAACAALASYWVVEVPFLRLKGCSTGHPGSTPSRAPSLTVPVNTTLT